MKNNSEKRSLHRNFIFETLVVILGSLLLGISFNVTNKNVENIKTIDSLRYNETYYKSHIDSLEVENEQLRIEAINNIKDVKDYIN